MKISSFGDEDNFAFNKYDLKYVFGSNDPLKTIMTSVYLHCHIYISDELWKKQQ